MRKSSRTLRRPRLRPVILLLTAYLIGWCGTEGMQAVARAQSSQWWNPQTTGEAARSFDYSRWIRISLGGPSVQGDPAQYMQRHGVPQNVFGGVEDFHWEQFVGDGGLFMVDGRAIVDNRDYLLRVRLDDPELGYMDAGYREFRSWFDGSGGFFPQNAAFFSIFDEELATDRARAWVEGGLTLPNLPRFTFRYVRQTRNGTKGSLAWGDSNLTGGFGTRSIVPSFWESDEVRNIVEGEVSHFWGGTDLGVRVRYERDDVDTSRNMRRRPMESSDRFLSQREGTLARLFNIHAFSETRLSDVALLTAGYAFTTVDSDLSGDRIYGAGFGVPFDPQFENRQFRDVGFLDLEGTSEMKFHLASLNMMLTPGDHFAVVPSLRLEKQNRNGASNFLETNVGGPPDLVTSQTPSANRHQRDLRDLKERVEARYTGFENWVFYGRGEWVQGRGDLAEEELDPRDGSFRLERRTDDRRSSRRYTAGTNWYPRQGLNVAARYYRRNRANEYEHPVNPEVGRYPAFLTSQDLTRDDVYVRVRWRPSRQLTLGSRFAYQFSTVDTTGDLVTTVRSAEIKRRVFTENVTWSPTGRFYAQVNLNWVRDHTGTPANLLEGISNQILESRNDFVNAALMTGLALTQRTDFEARYFYYQTDNFVDNSLFGQPFGAAATEHGVNLGVIRHIREAVRWSVRYIFFNNRDLTSGGNNNYEVHQVFSAIEYRF